MTRVSVVIPTYNSADYLGTTIESVLAQTTADLELLVIDDGSRDDTGAVVQRYAAADDRIQYHAQRNAGPSAARNNGIARARGEWVAFLDSDDLWKPRKLEAQLDAAERVPSAGLVYCSATVGSDATSVTQVYHAEVEGDALEALISGNLVTGSCSSAMVRRDVLDAIGVFDPALRYAEDWDLWLRIAASYLFARVDEPLVHRVHRDEGHGADPIAIRDSSFVMLERAFSGPASRLRSHRQTALAAVHYRAAIHLQTAGRYREARRELVSGLRRRPFHFPSYRRLVRMALPVG